MSALPKEVRVRKGMVLGLMAVTGLTGVALAQSRTPDVTVTPTQVAAAACAELPEAECASTTGCVWLPGYKVANGTEVKGYCRPAPKPLTARRPPAAH